MFSGTTDDVLDPVTLHVYAGTDITASPVQTLVNLVPEVAILEATWSTATPEPLEPGQYTAVAEQRNVEPETGVSPAVTFTIDTSPPDVSIDSVSSPGKDETPTFTGAAGTAAGDASTVAVKVYEGASVSGSPVRSLSGSVSGSTWTAGPVAPSLPDGTYTAVVSQDDEAGNVGTSAAVTFTVDTTPPVVSFSAVPSPGKDATPTFTGGAGTAAGDDSTVTVAVYEGASVSGSPVRTMDGTVGGSTWTAGPVAPGLPDGVYTAQVSQDDEAGNVGTSAAVTFTVDTTPPVVSFSAVPSPSKVTTPTFTGAAGVAAGDASTVAVKVYEGASVAGSPVRSLSGSVSGSTWTAGPVAHESPGWRVHRAGLAGRRRWQCRYERGGDVHGRYDRARRLGDGAGGRRGSELIATDRQRPGGPGRR